MVQTQEGCVAIMPHLVWQQEAGHPPADGIKERATKDLTARGLASWTEDQDWQD